VDRQSIEGREVVPQGAGDTGPRWRQRPVEQVPAAFVEPGSQPSAESIDVTVECIDPRIDLVVILPETPGELACAAAERVRRAIAADPVNARWGEWMGPIMKVEIDPATDFPYLLPKQFFME
jgi:hypothetical protein